MILKIFVSIFLSWALVGCAIITTNEHKTFPVAKDIRAARLSFKVSRIKHGDESTLCFTKPEADRIARSLADSGVQHDPFSRDLLDIEVINVSDPNALFVGLNVGISALTYFIFPIYKSQQYEVIVKYIQDGKTLQTEKGRFGYESIASSVMLYNY